MAVIPAHVRFIGDLNDLLPAARRHTWIAYRPDQEHPGLVTVKHALETLGVPHPEVEQIVVESLGGGPPRGVAFSEVVEPGDRLTVYPLGCPAATALPVHLRPPRPDPARFVLDTHLGRLANYLRIFGFDTRYRNDADDADLADLAAAEDRILLSRDVGLLKRRVVVHGHWVRSSNPAQQIVAILRRYELTDQIRLWSRCPRCNGALLPVDKEAILDRLEPKTRLYYDDFRRCLDCGQIYWRGSHTDRMAGFVDQILAQLAGPVTTPCD
jgi:uncharacterized protein